MKIRQCFVSNSSSSSFVIMKRHLSRDQIDKIFNHIEESKKLSSNFYNDKRDEWSVNEDEDKLKFYTSMDNFNMWRFLELIYVPESCIESVDEEWHS